MLTRRTAAKSLAVLPFLCANASGATAKAPGADWEKGSPKEAGFRPDGLEAELSLYERRFQNKIAFDRDGLSALELNGDGDELAHLGASVTDHLPSLTAALSVSTNDILTVTDDALGDLDLATISLLFRHASLARALGLPIHDLVSLRQVSGVDPFASPSDTLRFADMIGHLQAAGIDFILCKPLDPKRLFKLLPPIGLQ